MLGLVQIGGRPIKIHSTESQMRCAGQLIIGVASGRPVARAIIARAQEGTPLDDPRSHAGLVGIVAGLARRAADRLGAVATQIPAAGPFPDITDGIVKTEVVGLVTAYWRQSLIAIADGIDRGECPLPGIGLGGCRLGSQKGLARRGRALELLLVRQAAARPTGIGRRIDLSDLYDRPVGPVRNAAARPLRMAPVGAPHNRPPLVRRDRQFARARRAEHDAVAAPFGHGHIAGRRDEAGVLGVRYFVRVHPEALDGRLVGRPSSA